MQYTAEYLRKRLLETVEHGTESVIDGLEERPVFFLFAQSFLGGMHADSIAAATRGLVAVIDDRATEATLHGVPRWSSAQLLERAKDYPNAVVIDFSYSMPARALAVRLCEVAGVERRDCVVAQAQLGLVAVYEPVASYRSSTLARIDDFVRIADRLDDEHSRATLFANLLFRLTYDRSYIMQTCASPLDEYFSSYATTSTFRMGTREHFCDCGAYQGPIVRKFLEATGHRYGSITAFEPDRINFEALGRIMPLPLPNFRTVNKAVSSHHETLRFRETGTVSSYITNDGTVEVSTTKLDDELEKLTFLKMDVEGFEAKTLQGVAGLLREQRPRVAACVYHYAQDLLDVMEQFDRNVENYNFRLRQTCGGYYFDLVLYASPQAGIEPPAWAQ